MLPVFPEYNILRVLEVFPGAILWILLRTASISDVCTAGTAYTRGSVLPILPVLAVFGPSVQIIVRVLVVFRPPVLQYQVLSTRDTKCTRYSGVPSIEYARSI